MKKNNFPILYSEAVARPTSIYSFCSLRRTSFAVSFCWNDNANGSTNIFAKTLSPNDLRNVICIIVFHVFPLWGLLLSCVTTWLMKTLRVEKHQKLARKRRVTSISSRYLHLCIPINPKYMHIESAESRPLVGLGSAFREFESQVRFLAMSRRWTPWMAST